MKKLIALIISLTVVLALVGCNNASDEPKDYPPMVMFNDILYSAASYSGDEDSLTLSGKIEDCIDYGVPTENNQANDALVGCEIYTTSSAPDYIFVLNDGVYSPYKASENENKELTDYPPMVMFNDILYSAASYSGDKDNLTLAGEIEDCIDYGVPTENNQANDDLVGCEIYTTSSAPDYIFVLNDDIYSPYKASEE